MWKLWLIIISLIIILPLIIVLKSIKIYPNWQSYKKREGGELISIPYWLLLIEVVCLILPIINVSSSILAWVIFTNYRNDGSLRYIEFTTELWPEWAKNLFNDSDETNVWNEYQGNFKTGALELDLLNHGFKAHNLKDYSGFNFNLVVSHMDDIMHNGRFSYLNHDVVHNVLTNSPEKVLGIMKDNLDLEFSHIFYSDNKYSIFTQHE